MPDVKQFTEQHHRTDRGAFVQIRDSFQSGNALLLDLLAERFQGRPERLIQSDWTPYGRSLEVLAI